MVIPYELESGEKANKINGDLNNIAKREAIENLIPRYHKVIERRSKDSIY